MGPLDLNDFIEFDDRKVNPVVLANEPDIRLLLLCMRAGQRVPEHSAAGSITVQSVTGRATFYDGEEACEMFAGSLVRLEAGRPHRVEAHTDAALLVTMIKPSGAGESGGARRAAECEIDLCLMERPERHPLVFAAFDRLAVGESLTIHNDHDPQPLRIQIEQMRQGEVSWEYLERGPDTFRIRLTRVAPPTAERRRGNEARAGGDN
ncbi:MAG TPA: DUF2249 domain-containing protein [Pyrinomonadaceae bacterium]|nr:DUF2249 domain-containing protein [Pyrinomonadaceae bacterium]